MVFYLSMSVLPKYMYVLCVCVCVFMCMDGCVTAGFHTGFFACGWTKI